jgi:Zn-dependent metalloprotease
VLQFFFYFNTTKTLLSLSFKHKTKTRRMKKTNILLFIICILFLQKTSFSQLYYGGEAQKIISEANSIAFKSGYDLPVYIKLQDDKKIEFNSWQTWISTSLKLSPEFGFVLQNTQTDLKGDVHYRYCQTYLGIPILGSTYIVHTSNNEVYSFNGEIISSSDIAAVASISEEAALSYALSEMNATIYKWQIPSEENLLKQTTGDPTATYYPKGELYLVPEGGDLKSKYLRLAYRFDIYASKPLKRAYVFVDAVTGEIILSLDRIRTTDTPGTAETKYSGTQTIITDSYNGSYRLREAGRGLGIETYDMNTGTDYASAVDFTDDDNNWNNINAEQDEVATDAHFGAEMTYDYYLNTFNRNSIDGNGFKLMSYVHYDVGYVNAFWDGQEMTYGDGDASYTPLTTLDICGHEITHGLDENTANLIYQDESGALNEGYSDIFGTCIERYARPSNCNWTMGEDIGTPFRDMSDPNVYGQPDTYLGTNWDPNQEVHQNSGVLSYWFYLSSMGGSGTNDNGDAYNITGISIDSAAAVAFRTLTIYLTSGATYADARFYSILSAMDLFGACTPEVETVTNAWYAVGVGGIYNPTVISDFTANTTALCSIPSTVNFTNMSTNSNQFFWDFGDGTTSTAMSPSHVYTAYGNYDVSLIAYGGSCGNDTLVQTAFISVDTLNPCIVIMPASGTADMQTACAGQLFDSGGSSNYQDNTNSSITIAPIGAMNVTLQFSSFSMEQNYDYLTIYDGPSTASTLIGSYTGASLPNGGTIVSTGGSITLVQTSDQAVNESGYEINWQCSLPTAPPVANFMANDTQSCTGIINFSDFSTNGPTSWLWDFGDGGTSTLQNPVYTYTSNGTYDVTLTATNTFGNDQEIKTNYIIINLPASPSTSGDTICGTGSASLSASGFGTLQWFDAATGGTLVNTGTTYNTPAISTTTTYYVEDNIPGTIQNCAKPDNTGGGGYTSSGDHYLIFDSSVPVTLVSVKMYGNTTAPGNKTIELRNNTGTVIQSATVNVLSGLNTYTVNFDIPAGTNLQLGCEGTDLYRNNSGVTFPYSLIGYISITNSSAGANYYYYFYDWVIQDPSCISSRTPVTAVVEAAPIAGFTYLTSGFDATFTNTTTNGTLYDWDFGDGNTSQQSDPLHTYSSGGTYTVTLVSENLCGSDTFSTTITISGAGIIENSKNSIISIYPNPSDGLLFIDVSDLNGNNNVQYFVYDMIGNLINAGGFNPVNKKIHAVVHMEGISKGVYFIRLYNETLNNTSKIIIK